MQQSPLNQVETAENAAENAEDNPALSNVIERNIRTIIRLRLKAARARNVQVRSADAIPAFSGRMLFVYVHIAWFAVWILLNTGKFGAPAFDPFPYGLLTMIVSLVSFDRIEPVYLRYVKARTDSKIDEHGEDMPEIRNWKWDLIYE